MENQKSVGRNSDHNFCELIEIMGGRDSFLSWETFLETKIADGPIFIVEDDEEIRESLKYVLEIEGYDVTCAENGQVALDTLRKGARPSVILLDLMMPVMNGWEFSKIVSQDAELSQIPIVVMTAFSGKNAEIPAHDVFVKPLDLNRLFPLIEKYSHPSRRELSGGV